MANPNNKIEIPIDASLNTDQIERQIKEINTLTKKIRAAERQGNMEEMRRLDAQFAKAANLKGGGKPAEIKYSMVLDNVDGRFKKVSKSFYGDSDEYIKAQQKIEKIHSREEVHFKKKLDSLNGILAKEKEVIAALQKRAGLGPKNLAALQKQQEKYARIRNTVKEVEKIIPGLETPASLQGQLAEVNQALGKTSVGVYNFKKGVMEVNPEYTKLIDKQKIVVKKLAASKQGAKSFGASLRNVGNIANTAMGVIGIIAASIGAIAGAITMVVGRQKQLQQLTLTLEGVGVSLNQQTAVLASSRRIALSYGVSLTKIEGAFKRLAPAILEAGGSLKDTEGAIESISARTTMLGLNTEQAGRYIEAFAQVMGKGKLQGEELNQQFAELDGGLRGQLQNYLAAEHGITDFEDAMKRGEITSGLFLKAFEAINKEIREKFLRDIDKTSESIQTLGEKGGMTISQFMAKMDTLTKIGLEEVGRTLAPIGKALARIYAAFVQIFTKAATEMPGLNKVVRFLAELLGDYLSAAVNSVLLAFGALLKIIDEVATAAFEFGKMISELPVIGSLFKGLMKGLKMIINPFSDVNKIMDKEIDLFSKLSDKTKGLEDELISLEEEIAALNEEFAGNYHVEEYQKKLDALNTKKATLELRRLKEEVRTELDQKTSMQEELEKRKKVEEEKMKLMADALKEKLELEAEALEKTKEGIEEERTAAEERYEVEKKAIEDAYQAKYDALDKEKEMVAKNSEAESKRIDRLKEEAKAYYDQQKKDLEDTRAAAEARYDAEKEAIAELKKEAQDTYDNQIKELDAVANKVNARYDLEIQKLNEVRRETEAAIDATEGVYEEQSRSIESRFDSVLTGLSKEKAAVDANFSKQKAQLAELQTRTEYRYDSEISNIKRASDRSRSAFESRKRQLEAELSAMERVYDQLKDQIDAQRQASQDRSDSRIGALEEMTPAERQLAALDLYELRKKAVDQNISSRERLEARARLERMQREQQIEQERVAEAARQKAFEEQQRQAELAHLAEKERVEAEILSAEEKQRRAQERFQEQEAAALEAKERAVAAIAAKQAQADADRQVALEAIEAKERQAQEARELALQELEEQKDQALLDLQQRLDEQDTMETKYQLRREADLKKLEEKKDEAKARLEARNAELESMEARLMKAKERMMEELEEKKDELVLAEQARTKQLENMAEKLKEARKKKEQEIDQEKDRLAKEEEKRLGPEGLEGKYNDLYDAIDQRLEDVDNQLEKNKEKQDEITDAVAKATMTQEQHKTAIEATFGALDQQLAKVTAIANQYARMNKDIQNLESRQEALNNTTVGSGSTPSRRAVATVGDKTIFSDGSTQPASTASRSSRYSSGVNSTPQVVEPTIVEPIKAAAQPFGQAAGAEITQSATSWGERAGEEFARNALPGPIRLLSQLGGAGARKSGGPVTAGLSYKVNEQGQEGFLSSSGLLSAIKTPRLGKWTAPSSGTVINAKTWSQIKKASGGSIPKDLMQRSLSQNGVSVGSGNAGASQGGILASVMGALGQMGGDNFNNNITIQSQNPTRTAGDMMVAMARMKHRR